MLLSERDIILRVPSDIDPDVGGFLEQMIRELNLRLKQRNDWHRDAEAEGSVLFMGPNGIMEDNDAIHWDNTNKRLGIGTDAPDYDIEVRKAANPVIATKDTTNNVATKLQSLDSSGLTGTESNHDWEWRTNNAIRGRVDAKGNVVIGTAQLADNATDGFLYIPTTTSGAPTGTPTAHSGMVPMVYDDTNNNLYVYNGGWKKVTLS